MDKELKGTNEWGVTKIPQFTGKKALVLPGAFFSQVVLLMAEAGFEKADSVEDADVVVFTGGADVNPSLYEQEKLPNTFCNPSRDEEEREIYKKCLELGKVCFGICRGMQLLAVLNDCELWQHVDNHAGNSHYIYDIDLDVRVMATSVHHQMVIPNDDMEIIAITEKQISRTFRNANLYINLDAPGSNNAAEIELEACAFHDTKCFLVQGHPEVGTQEYKSWTFETLKRLMDDWTEAEEEDELNAHVEEAVTKVFG